MSRRFCFALDLKGDPALIAEYRRYHEKIWPEITQSLKSSGIEDLEIYLLGTRMFMIMEGNQSFSFEKKADEQNPKVQAWEQLMWRFQQALPEAKPGEKCYAWNVFLSSKLSWRGTLNSRCESKTLKLIRFGEAGGERPGVLLDDDSRLDVSDFVPDYDGAFFARGGMEALRDWLKTHVSSAPRVPSTIRLGPPICRPSKIICIGLNYRDHAAETGAPIPKEPAIFFKATTSLVGPNDALVIPRNATKVDWEVELAFVIGKTALYVPRDEALDYVAGYVLHNDYSERSFQLERGGQWVKGKSADTFAPLGPFLASPDELRDPRNLKMWLKVNGEIRQNSSTANMIFEVATLLSYVSEFMTLLPGDVISTGTPAGVGLGMKPPQYLQSGDVVELGIEGLGESRQRVVNFSEQRYSETV